MTNREKFTEIFGCEIVQRDTGEAIPGHCVILIASDKHFNEWLKQEYVPSAQLAQDLTKGCTDTISREAAIKAMRKAKDKSEAHRMLIQLPSAQPGWIPTSVKPPEPFKLVLIQDYCGCYELNTYIPPRINPKQYPNGYWGEVGTVDFDYFDVEAWCPLPAPYCPEGEEHEQSD